MTFVARTASRARIEGRIAGHKEAALHYSRPSHTTEPTSAHVWRGNVGWIELSEGGPDRGPDIRICFGAGRYWAKRLGISAVKNLGLRLHMGTRCGECEGINRFDQPLLCGAALPAQHLLRVAINPDCVTPLGLNRRSKGSPLLVTAKTCHAQAQPPTVG